MAPLMRFVFALLRLPFGVNSDETSLTLLWPKPEVRIRVSQTVTITGPAVYAGAAGFPADWSTSRSDRRNFFVGPRALLAAIILGSHTATLYTFRRTCRCHGALCGFARDYLVG